MKLKYVKMRWPDGWTDGWTDIARCRVLCLLVQVTRGHNIVADGWAGASNPHPHLNPQPNRQTYTKSI